MESGARIAALAVFASVAGAWLFAVLFGHAAAVVTLLALQQRSPRAGAGRTKNARGGATVNGVQATTAAGITPRLRPRPWRKVFRVVAPPLPARLGWLGCVRAGAGGGSAHPEGGLTRVPTSAAPLAASPAKASPPVAVRQPQRARLRAHLPDRGGGGGGGGGDACPLGCDEAPPPPPSPSPSLTTTQAHATPARSPRAIPFALPRSTDAALLAACLAWPPSFYVSDATDRSGAFWWRARMLGRKSCASVAPGAALIPFAPYTGLVAAEAAVLLGVAWARSPPWAIPYVAAAVVLHLLWGLAGAMWLTAEVAAASDGGAADAALERAAAGAEAAALAAELAAVEAAGGGAGGGGGGDGGGEDEGEAASRLEAGLAKAGGGAPAPVKSVLAAAGGRTGARRASEPVAGGRHRGDASPSPPSEPVLAPLVGHPAADAAEPGDAEEGDPSFHRAASTPVRGRHGSAGPARPTPPCSPRPGRYTVDGGAADDAVAVGSPANDE
jgi:hypothetical protein